MVTLEELRMNAELRRLFLKAGAKLLVGGAAVDFRLPQSEHIHIRTVYNKDIHFKKSSKTAAAGSSAPPVTVIFVSQYFS